MVISFLILAVGSTSFRELFNTSTRLNALLATFGLSIILIPAIPSLTEDALRAVPDILRMASYSLGINKFATIKNVVILAAIRGVLAGIILGFGRAIGETMIVLMASGNAAELTLYLLHSVRTITATIAGVPSIVIGLFRFVFFVLFTGKSIESILQTGMLFGQPAIIFRFRFRKINEVVKRNQ